MQLLQFWETFLTFEGQKGLECHSIFLEIAYQGLKFNDVSSRMALDKKLAD